MKAEIDYTVASSVDGNGGQVWELHRRSIVGSQLIEEIIAATFEDENEAVCFKAWMKDAMEMPRIRENSIN